MFASVNPRNKKDIENPARGIAKILGLSRRSRIEITKYGSVKCIAGHDMVFLSKDYNLDSYIFGCPVLNNEARRKLEHMGWRFQRSMNAKGKRNAARILLLAGYIVSIEKCYLRLIGTIPSSATVSSSSIPSWSTTVRSETLRTKACP